MKEMFNINEAGEISHPAIELSSAVISHSKMWDVTNCPNGMC